MYRFEWNFKTIKDQRSFEQFRDDMLKEDNPYFKLPANYEQAARLFYQHDNGECVMIELQVPTYELMKLLELDKDEVDAPWLEAFKVKSMDDYDASNEIYTGIGNGEVITFENAEELMLQLAKEMFEEQKGCVCMENIREQYDETLREVERLIDNLKALHTNIINASESDNLTMENSEELDWMCLTVDSAMQSVEEVAQAMAR